VIDSVDEMDDKKKVMDEVMDAVKDMDDPDRTEMMDTVKEVEDAMIEEEDHYGPNYHHDKNEAADEES